MYVLVMEFFRSCKAVNMQSNPNAPHTSLVLAVTICRIAVVVLIAYWMYVRVLLRPVSGTRTRLVCRYSSMLHTYQNSGTHRLLASPCITLSSGTCQNDNPLLLHWYLFRFKTWIVPKGPCPPSLSPPRLPSGTRLFSPPPSPVPSSPLPSHPAFLFTPIRTCFSCLRNVRD